MVRKASLAFLGSQGLPATPALLVTPDFPVWMDSPALPAKMVSMALPVLLEMTDLARMRFGLQPATSAMSMPISHLSSAQRAILVCRGPMVRQGLLRQLTFRSLTRPVLLSGISPQAHASSQSNSAAVAEAAQVGASVSPTSPTRHGVVEVAEAAQPHS